MPQTEAKARIKINKLLEEAGWRFFDNENGKANIEPENNVKINQSHFNEFGEDFEQFSCSIKCAMLQFRDVTLLCHGTLLANCPKT